MIFLGGVPFPTDSSSSSSLQGTELQVSLMEHPLLVSASASFKAIPERKISILQNSGSGETQQSKFVYVFQREYATVDPALVDFVGTDEATTCVGLVIRSRANGMTSVAHMDSARIVKFGLTQMLSLIVHQDLNTELDVHVVGAFEDVTTNHANSGSRLASHAKVDGYSFPLVTKIVEALHKRPEKFHIQTLFVLAHNTRKNSEGNAYPIFNGLLVETATGSVVPACFDRTSRCPDEIVGEFEFLHAMKTSGGMGSCLRHMILKLIVSVLLHAIGTNAKNVLLWQCRALWTQRSSLLAQLHLLLRPQILWRI